MTYLQFLLAEAMGLRSDDPKVLSAIKALEKAKVVTPSRVQAAELRHRIDSLRAQGVTAVVIAQRLGISRRWVTKVVTARLETRRSD